MVIHARDRSNDSEHRQRRWLRSVLLTMLIAELGAIYALRSELWGKAGTGWLYWLLVASDAVAIAAAAGLVQWLVKHRFQFNLKFLLFLMLLAAAGLGLFEKTRKQRHAVATLRKLGATVRYSGEHTPGSEASVIKQFFQTPVAAYFMVASDGRLLAHLEALQNLEELSVFGQSVHDDDLVHLAALRKLESLRLINTGIRGHGLSNIARLPRLRTLDLGGSTLRNDALVYFRFSHLQSLSLRHTRIGNTGLERICTMPDLTALNLDGTQVTDAGISHLARITTLEELSLEWTKVTDAGLIHLKTSQALRNLRLQATAVTDAGVADLQHSLPECVIVWDTSKKF